MERGDIMYFDTSGVVDRYHVDLCRTIAIGDDHPEVRGKVFFSATQVAADPLGAMSRVVADHYPTRVRPPVR